jgi:hypothetical protein
MGFKAGDSNLYRYLTNSPLLTTDASGLQERNYQAIAISGVPITKGITDVTGPNVTDWFAYEIAAQIEFRYKMRDLSKNMQNAENWLAWNFTMRQAPWLMAPKWFDFGSPEQGKGMNTVVVHELPLRKNQLGNIEFGVVGNLYPVANWDGTKVMQVTYENFVEKYDPTHPYSENGKSFKGLRRADNVAAFGVGAAIADEIRGLRSFGVTGYPTQAEVKRILVGLFSDPLALGRASQRYASFLGDEGKTMSLDTLTFIEYYDGFNTASLKVDPNQRPFIVDKNHTIRFFMETLFPQARKAMNKNLTATAKFLEVPPINIKQLDPGIWMTRKTPDEKAIDEWLRVNHENYAHPRGSPPKK